MFAVLCQKKGKYKGYKKIAGDTEKFKIFIDERRHENSMYQRELTKKMESGPNRKKDWKNQRTNEPTNQRK